MSALVTAIRRRNRAGLWGWEITPREGPFAGRVVAMVAQIHLRDARFATSTQTKVEGKVEHEPVDMAGSVRVEKRNLRYHRVDTGWVVDTAQVAWLTPLGNIFAVGLE